MKRPEQILQQLVAEYLEYAAVEPNVVWWHTPNGGGRSKAEAGILRSMGVKPGVSDLAFLWKQPNSNSPGIGFIELKAPKGKPPTPAQVAFLNNVHSIGCHYSVCKTLEEVIAALDMWGVPLRPVYLARKVAA